MNELSKSILKTLCYADIFDYPLSDQEIAKFQISNFKIQINSKFQISKSKIIKKKDSFYFLKGREKLVEIRRRRQRWSREKMFLARQVAKWLKLIPTVKMVTVTGALAMDNAKEEDDIDLLIVTSSGWLWTTRFLTTVLVELVSKRRRPGETDFQNKICLNMFLDENHLTVPVTERDLFSAHEAAQVKLLWGRGEMYGKFMAANQWIKDFLPNIQSPKIHTYLIDDRWSVIHVFLGFIETLLKKIQLYYMRERRTSEMIREGYLRFHPRDARRWVLAEHEKRLKKYGI